MHLRAGEIRQSLAVSYSLKYAPAVLRVVVLSCASAVCSLAQAPGYTISTVAGGGSSTGSGVPATSAYLPGADGMVFDAAGDLYFAIFANDLTGTVRKITPNGVISVVAGGGPVLGSLADGGPATNAALNGPIDVAVDNAGNLYIAESNGNRIRKMDASGTISTFAGTGSTGPLGDGGPATVATLSGPSGLAMDSLGNLYVADVGYSRIRKVSPAGIITTVVGTGAQGFAGDGGQATAASLYAPTSVVVDVVGNIYIADAGNNRIRKVSTSGIITTIAGDGSQGYSGDGGLATLASFGLELPPNGVLELGVRADASGNVFIADQIDNRVRMVTPDGKINTVAGNGSATSSGCQPAVRNSRARSSFTDPNYEWIIPMKRFRPGVSLVQAQAALGPQFAEWMRTVNTARHRADLPGLIVREGRAGLNGIREQYSRPLFILLAVVGLILAIACANIANTIKTVCCPA